MAVDPFGHDALQRGTTGFEDHDLVGIARQRKAGVWVLVCSSATVFGHAPEVGLDGTARRPCILVITALAYVHNVEDVCFAENKAIGVGAVVCCFL